MKIKPIKRKRIIVFAFEGKNNKTESQYFFHFKPKDNNYLLKQFPTGMTDPKGMVSSTKIKRKAYDYNPKEDLTFIFMDSDNPGKLKQIKEIQTKLPKDIRIIITNPCFELWFLNHFIKTSKQFNNVEVIEELKKFIPHYQKNLDVYHKIAGKLEIAIKNSVYQKSLKQSSTTDVVTLFIEDLLEEK